MGLRVNTNVIAIKAQRYLLENGKLLNQALERLASGSRINSAGDDAAGLAISEGLRSQVKGLRRAILNANDALGFLSTAEGAMGEQTGIVQRLRELSIQAANGTLSNTDRGFLNNEAQALLEEFQRIASSSEFNGVFLLDGSFTTTTLQVGTQKGQTIAFNIGDARSTSIGALASLSGAQGNINGFGGSFTINGIAISQATTTDDTVSTINNSYSALAIAKKINLKQGQTNVKASVLESVVTIYDLSFGAFDGILSGSDLQINGLDIAGTRS